MAQFPLALAIEPRLLPLATANGFHMDSKVGLELLTFIIAITRTLLNSIATSCFAKCLRKRIWQVRVELKKSLKMCGSYVNSIQRELPAVRLLPICDSAGHS